VECVVPGKIHTHPMEGHWKFLGGGGLKSQNYKQSMKLSWNLLRGGGVHNGKTFCGERKDIFWYYTLYM